MLKTFFAIAKIINLGLAQKAVKTSFVIKYFLYFLRLTLSSILLLILFSLGAFFPGIVANMLWMQQKGCQYNFRGEWILILSQTLFLPVVHQLRKSKYENAYMKADVNCISRLLISFYFSKMRWTFLLSILVLFCYFHKTWKSTLQKSIKRHSRFFYKLQSTNYLKTSKTKMYWIVKFAIGAKHNVAW